VTGHARALNADDLDLQVNDKLVPNQISAKHTTICSFERILDHMSRSQSVKKPTWRKCVQALTFASGNWLGIHCIIFFCFGVKMSFKDWLWR
jgi:hypothetical protein